MSSVPPRPHAARQPHVVVVFELSVPSAVLADSMITSIAEMHAGASQMVARLLKTALYLRSEEGEGAERARAGGGNCAE